MATSKGGPPGNPVVVLLENFRKRGIGPLVWLAVALLVLTVTLMSTFTVIDPGQVAVRVNNLTGARDTIVQPGLVLRAPFGLHSIYVLDASPQTFVMKGTQNTDDLHVVELTVRASDGSNFLFNDTTIIFQVAGDRAEDTIRDAGVEGAFRRWMRPYARSILRDEFGRESTISVSNPANFGAATERARARLNQVLEAHGLVVTQIVTPRPRFSEEYENLIESRNGAENQLAVIQSELTRAGTDRSRRLAEVDRDQNKIIQEKRAELETTLATAIAEQAETIRIVDSYRIDTVAKGQAAVAAAQRKADELRGQLEAEFGAQQASIEAFRDQPVERVMERLGSKLAGVTIGIQPYANDGRPSRIELEQIGGGK